MSAGQEIGSPLTENRTLLPAPLPPDEARGRSPPPRGCLRSGYALPSTPPQRHSHPDCRAVLTLIVALDQLLLELFSALEPGRFALGFGGSDPVAEERVGELVECAAIEPMIKHESGEAVVQAVPNLPEKRALV